MKLFLFGVASGTLLTALIQPAISQDIRPGQPEQLHMQIATPQGNRVSMTALSMQRDGRVIHLKGHVEIKSVMCVPAADASTAKVCEEAMVLRTDEADYHVDTGEIEARGNVKIIPHQPVP